MEQRKIYFLIKFLFIKLAHFHSLFQYFVGMLVTAVIAQDNTTLSNNEEAQMTISEIIEAAAYIAEVQGDGQIGDSNSKLLLSAD